MSDFFSLFSLPRQFTLDRSELERAYLTRSRESHPDYHAGDESKTAESAVLNEAYQTLKDPYRRAEYLLSLAGGPTASEEKKQDAQFLMEMMEWQEKIESAQADPAIRESIEFELSDREAAMISAAGAMLDTPPVNFVVVRSQLNAVKTIRSLLRSLRNESEL